MTGAAVRTTVLAVLLAAATSGVPAQRATTPRNDAQTPRTSAPMPPAPEPRPDRADLDAVHRIKDEGLQRSEVMETAWQLTEVFGPRLTNSPGMRAAGEWAVQRLAGWGLSNAHKAPWGPFGRGWINDRLTVNELAPLPKPLPAFARA